MPFQSKGFYPGFLDERLKPDVFFSVNTRSMNSLDVEHCTGEPTVPGSNPGYLVSVSTTQCHLCCEPRT